MTCLRSLPSQHCCAGNFFFAGARLFVGSLEAAIFLFSRVARIPEGSEVSTPDSCGVAAREPASKPGLC